VEQGQEERYAGFWLRVVAFLVDTLVLMPANFVMGFVLGVVLASGWGVTDQDTLQAAGSIMGIVLAWLYYTLMTSSRFQGTLGKMAVGAKVIDQGGERIGLGRANARYWSKILSGVLLMIGYLMVAFTTRKQGLHDKLASTLVVRRV